MDKKYFSIAKWIAEYLGRVEEPEHQTELEEWRKEERNEELVRKIEREGQRRLEQRRYDDFSCQEGWEKLQTKRLQLRRRHLYRQIYACAAVIVMFLGTALFLWLKTDHKEIVPVLVQNIEAGGPKAHLILEDGKEVDLEEQHGVIEHTLTSIQNAENCLTYQMAQQTDQEFPVFHEIVIPVGGEYQLKLSDGTLVFLNAMSRLRFPNFFKGTTREVELEGEAYFKVTKNPEQPFVVKSANSTVYVYGTEFNISAYPDEATSHTTLVVGALTVEQDGQSRKIHPGEQWCYDKQHKEITIAPVDVTLYTAWKDGKLRFNDARLEDIMRTIGRWYGVEIAYQEEELKDLRFGCNFSRHSSIDPLLRVFGANGKIVIERSGNQLKIKRGR